MSLTRFEVKHCNADQNSLLMRTGIKRCIRSSPQVQVRKVKIRTPSHSQILHTQLDEALSLQSTNLRRAIELAETAFFELTDSSNKELLGRASYVLGSLLRLTGSSYRRAEQLLLKAQTVSMTDTQRRSLLVQLGQLYLEMGQLEKANDYLVDALRSVTNTDHLLKRADILLNLANVRARQADSSAKALYDEALLMYSEMGDEEGMAITLTNYGLLFHQNGRSDEAVQTLSDAVKLFSSIGQERSRGIALQMLAEVYLALKEYNTATLAIETSLDIAERSQLLALRADGLRLLAEIKDQQGEARAAKEHREEADALNAVIGRPPDF